MLDKIKKFFSPDKPKIDLTLADLKKGFILDYFMESWEVKSHGEYSYDGGSYASEFLIDCGNKKHFLYVEEDDMLADVTLSISVPMNAIDTSLRSIIQKTDEAPDSFEFEGETYYFVECSSGLYKDYGQKQEEAVEFVMYDFKNKTEDKIVSIVRWSETDFEASKGYTVKKVEFSNILPI